MQVIDYMFCGLWLAWAELLAGIVTTAVGKHATSANTWSVGTELRPIIRAKMRFSKQTFS